MAVAGYGEDVHRRSFGVADREPFAVKPLG